MAEFEEPCCSNCAYWQEGGNPLATARRDIAYPLARPGIGVCRASPPVVLFNGHFPASLFAETHESQFCIDHIDPEPPESGGGERQDSNVIAFGRSAA